MKRHPFRWDAVAFGLFFLAVLGQWMVWEQDLMSPDDLAYVGAGVLIALGLIGIVGTVVGARSERRSAPFTPIPTPEPTSTDEPADDAATHGGNPA